MKINNKKFRSTMNKGFTMTFENGITASVQWGSMNYCDNYNYQNYFTDSKDSDTAEIAAWCGIDDDTKSLNFVTSKVFSVGDERDNGDVIGWLSPDEVLAFLVACANYQVKGDK